MVVKKPMIVKNRKYLDISLNLNICEKFRLKIYNDSGYFSNILNRAFYLRDSGCDINNPDDVNFVVNSYPELVSSLPYLEIIIRYQNYLYDSQSKDLDYFIDSFIDDQKDVNFNNELVELSKEDYSLSNRSLEKVELLDLLFVPKTKIPRLYFYKSVKNNLKQKIKNNLEINDNQINHLIDLIAKEKGYYVPDDSLFLPKHDKGKNKRLYRKRIANWFRDGGTYDLF